MICLPSFRYKKTLTQETRMPIIRNLVGVGLWKQEQLQPDWVPGYTVWTTEMSTALWQQQQKGFSCHFWIALVDLFAWIPFCLSLKSWNYFGLIFFFFFFTLYTLYWTLSMSMGSTISWIIFAFKSCCRSLPQVLTCMAYYLLIISSKASQHQYV